MKKSTEKNILYGFLAIVLFAGCSSMKPLQYPEVIYNHRQPLVSVTYEYGEIDIDIPIVFPGLVPDALSFDSTSLCCQNLNSFYRVNFS